MKPHGTYKIRYQRTAARSPARCAPSTNGAEPLERVLGALEAAEYRTARVLDSLHREIVEGGEDAALRIRRVFIEPREIFRVELERPDLGYQRTLLLGREALESLLEREEIHPALETLALAG
jgi:hypothetical protein